MLKINSRAGSMATAAVMAAMLAGSPAAEAQTLLDAILDIFGRPPPPASPVQDAPADLSPPRPHIVITPRWSSPSLGVAGYCVRLCDGRYFPLPRLQSSAASAQICESMCPKSRTLVLWGNSIDQARAANGSRYSDVATAFNYRSRIVPNCTCNGTDAFGTAAISIRADITLRPGDVVVTEKGARIFVGFSDDRREVREFVAAQDYPGMPADQRRTISEIQVSRRALLESQALDFNTRFVLDASDKQDRTTPFVNALPGK
jgi:hypothetical protein